jgi:hypothetical protein
MAMLSNVKLYDGIITSSIIKIHTLPITTQIQITKLYDGIIILKYISVTYGGMVAP